MDEEKSWLQKKLETPCYRSSMIYGISSGIGAGLAYFLFTSKPRTASHIGVASYCCVTLASWCYCRYQYTQKQIQVRLYKQAIEQQILTEGTNADPDLKSRSSNENNVSKNKLHEVSYRHVT